MANMGELGYCNILHLMEGKSLSNTILIIVSLAHKKQFFHEKKNLTRSAPKGNIDKVSHHLQKNDQSWIEEILHPQIYTKMMYYLRKMPQTIQIFQLSSYLSSSNSKALMQNARQIPSFQQGYFQTAICLFYHVQLSQAYQLFKISPKSYKQTTKMLLYMAISCISIKRYKHSLFYFQVYREVAKDRDSVDLKIAICYLLLKQVVRAVKIVDLISYKARTLTPAGITLLMQVCIKLRRYEKVFEYFALIKQLNYLIQIKHCCILLINYIRHKSHFQAVQLFYQICAYQFEGIYVDYLSSIYYAFFLLKYSYDINEIRFGRVILSNVNILLDNMGKYNKQMEKELKRSLFDRQEVDLQLLF